MLEKQYDFFISYNHKDERFASWIFFKAGNNFIHQMQHGAEFANHTLHTTFPKTIWVLTIHNQNGQQVKSE